MTDVDRLARTLLTYGRFARGMSRLAFDREEHTHPLVGLGGERLGRMIPGRGLLIEADLKRMGIRRPLPNVYERTPFQRALECLRSERAAINSIDDMQQALRQTRNLVSFGDSFGGQGAGKWNVRWPNGFTASPGTNPTRTNINAYNGAMTDPPTGMTKYLAGFGLMGNTPSNPYGFGMFILVDVLAEMGSVDLTTLGTKTVNTPALTRYTSGVGVYPAAIAESGGGVNFPAATTMQLGYTNAAGGAVNSTAWTVDTANGFPAFFDSTTDAFLGFFGTPDGCKQITSITISAASTSTPATAAFHLYKPLVFVHGYTDSSTFAPATYERESRSEPSMLIPLATTAGGVLGCLSGYWFSTGNAGSPNFQFAFDTFSN